MANTKVLQNVVINKKEAFVYLTLASDGTQETNYPVYDSSVVATAFGDGDPLTCQIMDCEAYLAVSTAARVVLRYDATTPVLALSCPATSGGLHFSADGILGLPNTAGVGITGDITLTTTGLAAGDSLTILLRVKRQ